MLLGQIPLGQAVKETLQQNLLLLPAGRRVPDPAELLDSPEFGRIVETLVGSFDRVVIDSPPVNAVSDVLLIAGFAQATCLVVRAGKTPKGRPLGPCSNFKCLTRMSLASYLTCCPSADPAQVTITIVTATDTAELVHARNLNLLPRAEPR